MCRSSTLNLEAKAGHASLVLVDDGLAIARWVIRFREQHAVVSLGLFVLAYTAWLTESMLIWTECGG